MEVVNGERMTECHLICCESFSIQTEAPQICCMCGLKKLPESSSKNPAVQTKSFVFHMWVIAFYKITFPCMKKDVP